MYPFHRQHHISGAASSGARHGGQSSHSHGRSSRDRGSKAEHRDAESEPPSPTHDQSQYRSFRRGDAPSDVGNVLRAKEKILLSSLNELCPSSPVDNRRRLGPSTENVFESLHRIAVASSRSCDHLHSHEYDVPAEEDRYVRRTSDNVKLSSLQLEDNQPLSVAPDTDALLDRRNKSPEDAVTCEAIRSVAVSSGEEGLRLKLDQVVVGSSEDRLLRIELVEPPDQNGADDQVLRVELSIPEGRDQASEGRHDDDVVCKPPLVAQDQLEEAAVYTTHGTTAPISLGAAAELKQLVLGMGTSDFSPQWKGQGFVFNTNQRLRYGFVQTKGGSCGVLAAVQAFLLKTLLFEPGATSSTEPLRPTRSEARGALVRALGEVLWQAGEGKSASLALCSGSTHLSTSGKRYEPDGITDRLAVSSFSSRALLEEAIRSGLEQFMAPSGNGCLLVVLSAVLSREVNRVKEDMDEASPLISPAGHCSLELVNLLVTGRAVSNVFDNTLQLDSCWLKGVHVRAEVGFLSLFEHYNSCQVGSYLKTPRFPVWVVCSENHFSVLFSCRRELVSNWRAEKRFHLYYYDGLARQQDEIKLTIDTTGLYLQPRPDTEKVSPLELCIRTKWKGAVVSWGDQEPTL